MNLRHTIQTVSLRNGATQALFVCSMAFTFSACQEQTPVETQAYFTPEAGVFPTAQTVSITLPPLATDVYLTTDTRDPVADPRCAYAGQSLNVNRPTTVKLHYKVEGVDYTQERLYVIEDAVTDSGFTNRQVIATWERFFVEEVYRKFNPSTNADSFLKITDSQGGSVSLETKILAYTFYGVPKRGQMIYSFDFFEKTNPDYNEVVMVNSGAIYGYQDGNGGYYTTLRNGGSTLKFSGTYNGWAEGDFSLDQDGRTTGGHYTVHCISNGCAEIPVTYALGSQNQLIEVSPQRDENSHTCTPPDPEPEPVQIIEG